MYTDGSQIMHSTCKLQPVHILSETFKKRRLHQVLSFTSANTIHGLAAGNEELKCRIDVEDLIAIEACYHAECRRYEQRKQQRSFQSDLSTAYPNVTVDDTMAAACQQLLHELDAGFEKKICIQFA